MASDPIGEFLSVVARIYLFKLICEPVFANSMMNTIDNMSDSPFFVFLKGPNRRDFVENRRKF